MDNKQAFVAEMSSIHGDLIGLHGIIETIMETASRGAGSADKVSDAITGAAAYLRTILDHMDHAILGISGKEA